MRLEKLLTDNRKMNKDDILLRIKGKCHPFIKEMSPVEGVTFMRATHRRINIGERIVPRTNRRPLETPLQIHNLLNDMFKKKFGWKVRGEGVFAMNSLSHTLPYYGYKFHFFPEGKYEYIWSPDVSDLTLWMEQSGLLNMVEDENDGVYGVSPNYNEKEIEEKLSRIIKTYKKTNLTEALRSKNEVVFRCKAYWLYDGKEPITYKELL